MSLNKYEDNLTIIGRRKETKAREAKTKIKNQIKTNKNPQPSKDKTT